MGNNFSSNLNEVQELINSIRRNASEDETLQTLSSYMETSTMKNKGDFLQNIKLKSISEIIKTDNLESFLEVANEGEFNLTDPIGRLQLTPLHLSAYHNSFNILKYLIKRSEVVVNSFSQSKDTPLNLALFSAENDTQAIELIRIFLQRKEVDIFLKNETHIFPLLITTQKKFTEASKLLLNSPSKEKIDNYETWDLIHVIKVALITNQESLANLISKNLGATRKLEILDEIEGSSQAKRSNLLNDLVKLLQKTVDRNSILLEAQITVRKKSPADEKAKELQLPSVPSTEIKRVAEVKDASGHLLRVGNIVRILSPQFVTKAIATPASPSDVEKLAEKLALIHGIYGPLIYIEIKGDQFVTRMMPEASVFHDEGITAKIGDGSSVRIGAYIQVIPLEEELKNIIGTGSVGWIHGMQDACGRTGKIVRFLRNSDILVQFPWGPRYFLKPQALLLSSADKLQTHDSQHNWIQVGSLVEITKPLKDFEEMQKENNLPCEGDYKQLPSKYVTIKAIQLTAFSLSKTVNVVYKGKPYFVHVGCIKLVEFAQDINGEDIRIGDMVQVEDDCKALKLAQKGRQESESDFGGWVDEMEDILGDVGEVTEIFCDQRRGINSLLVKVKFSEIASFYLNPRIVSLFTGTVVPKPKVRARASKAELKIELKTGEEESGMARLDDTIKAKVSTKTVTKIQPPGYETVISNDLEEIDLIQEDKWEEIDRSDLKCTKVLGQGAFGCVVAAEWNKNGEKKIVAIKQVNFGVTNGAGPLGEVMAEAKIQFSLRHPNIVSLFGVSLDKDLWIVMDFVDGRDLYTLLSPHDGSDLEFSFEKKLRLCLDICNAIAYIHQKGYVHCDVKPHNMMVDRREKLYVCDFGITQFLGNMDRMTFATQYTNDFGGTLYYIPPECLQPNEFTGKYRKPGFSSDVWALGAVFYEIFTRLHLYDHHMKFFNDKIAGNDVIVRRRMGDLPNTVRPIVAKALDFNHVARPSAQELGEFFHELVVPQD